MTRERGAGDRPRRSTHLGMPVAYAAVGVSRAPDLMRFPPEGSTPYEEELRLGSGDERFLIASSALMTWGAQRGGGVEVEVIERGPVSGYIGPTFDPEGRPQAVADIEEHYGPSGEPYLIAGTTAALRAPGQPPRRVLVVYTINEEHRVGFAWGTCDEEGPVGEQLFFVERRDDGTVWAVARGFLTLPRAGRLGVVLRGRVWWRAAIEGLRAQLAALTPGATSVGAQAAAESEAEAEAEPETEPGADAERTA